MIPDESVDIRMYFAPASADFSRYLLYAARHAVGSDAISIPM